MKTDRPASEAHEPGCQMLEDFERKPYLTRGICTCGLSFRQRAAAEPAKPPLAVGAKRCENEDHCFCVPVSDDGNENCCCCCGASEPVKARPKRCACGQIILTPFNAKTYGSWHSAPKCSPTGSLPRTPTQPEGEAKVNEHAVWLEECANGINALPAALEYGESVRREFAVKLRAAADEITRLERFLEDERLASEARGVHVTRLDAEVIRLAAELARAKDDIEHGRCCDDYERLLPCGHPRCVMSEVCEICIEISDKLEAVVERADAAEAKLAASDVLYGEVIADLKAKLTAALAHVALLVDLVKEGAERAEVAMKCGLDEGLFDEEEAEGDRDFIRRARDALKAMRGEG